MYKLLALDLDGTLVQRDGTVSADDKGAIAKLRRAGVAVTIATGRLYSGTASVADEVGLTGLLVCGDGAHIWRHPAAEVVRRRHISGDPAVLLRDALKRERLASFVMSEDAVLLDSGGAMFEGYVRGWTPRVEHVASVLGAPCWTDAAGVSGVVAIGLTERVASVRSALGDDRLKVTHFDVRQAPGVSCLLVRAAGVSKAEALAELAAERGWDMSEVVAVGDWLNDVEMLSAVGRSFAMGHAPEVVKSAATDRLSKDGGGVSEAIALAWPALS